jgi:hypothetical protein
MSDEPQVTAVQTEGDATDQGQESNLTEQTSKPEDDKSTGEDSTNGEDATGDTDDNGKTVTQDTYADFNVPEGATIDEKVLGEATSLFKDAGLNQEQAQKFIDLHAGLVQAGSTGQVEAFDQMKNDWREQSASDKEFGGDKFDESVGLARTAIEKFGTPGLSEILSDTGLGNHPEVIRFMTRVGELTKEDVPGNGNPSAAKKDHVSILYPKKSA